MGFSDGFKDFWNRQSRNFKIILVRDLINSLLGNLAGQYSTIYFKHLGAEAVEIGLLSSVSSFVRMALALPSGLLTDRVKRLKKLYIVGRVLTLPVSLIYAAARSWQIILATNVWSTITGRITMPAMNIISIESLSNRDRVSGIAIQRTLTSAVGFFTPILAAFLITYFGGLDNADSFRPLYVIQFFVGLITFLLLLIKLKEPNVDRTMPRRSLLTSMSDLFKIAPGVKRLLLMNAVNAFLMGLRNPFRILYFYDVKNADAFIIAWQAMVSTAVGLTLTVPMSQLADRVGRRKFAYASQIVYAICVLSALLTPPTHPEYLLLYSFFSSLGGTMEIGWQAFMQEYIPLEARGRWSGINTLVNALINIPAPIVGGLIWSINPDYAWVLGIINYAFISLPFRMSIPDIKKEGEGNEEP